MPADIIGILNQVSQIGLEATPGTAVAATKRLTSMGLPMMPQSNIQAFQPRGSKFASAHALTREWSEGSIDDESGLAYNEIQYVLASVLSKPSAPTTVSSPSIARTTVYAVDDGAVLNGRAYRVTASTTPFTTAGTAPAAFAGATTLNTVVVDGNVTWKDIGAAPGTTGYEWTFDIATYSRDNVQTYTIETGDAASGRAYRSAYCYFTGMSMESARADTISLGGDLVGHARENYSLTNIGGGAGQLVPATPAHLNVYMNDSAAALGTTQLDGNFTSSINISDRAGQAWFHGRQYRGPAGRVETRPEATFELVQADGSEVDAMLVGLKNSQRKFFRFEFVGPEVQVGVRNKLIWDIAGQIGDSSEWDEEEGVLAVTVPFAAEHDDTWGRAMRVRVVNGAAAL